METFKWKAADISATLAPIERNDFIRNNYSVWIGDLDFRRDELDRTAERVVAAQPGSPRQSTVASYLDSMDLTVNLLDGLAHEMRSRRPEVYYTR